MTRRDPHRPPPLIGFGTVVIVVALFAADAMWNHGHGLAAIAATLRAIVIVR